MSTKLIYDKYKKDNRCRNCGKELSTDRIGKSLCEKCSDKHTKYITENAVFFKAHNLCPRCGQNRLFGNEKNCPECRAKIWAYGINYKENHPEYVQKKKQKDKERRQFRIDNNLCVCCGDPLDDRKYKNCSKCRQLNKLRMRKTRCASGV